MIDLPQGQRDAGGKEVSKTRSEAAQLETYLVAVERDGAFQVLHQQTDVADRGRLSVTSSAMGWHRSANPGADARGPAAGHGLDVGVEANTFHAMHVMVAKQRALPAAKAVERHGHRDRDINADHADLHLVGKGACGVSVAGEDANAVAELVIVHQVRAF